MDADTWAAGIARDLLEERLPRRWAHSRQVAATATTLTPVLGQHTGLLTAAAWLHDIGYAPGVRETGFHPLDGARYLRDVIHADPLLCRLVAHHSAALTEATERGLAQVLSAEFPPPPAYLADALTYCDMTTGPTGQPVTIGQRLAEIRARYGDGHTVTRSIDRSAPQLTAAVHRVGELLTRHTAASHLARPAVLTVR